MRQVAILGSAFLLEQIAFEINRRVSHGPFGWAYQAMSTGRAMSDFVASIGIIGGFSFVVYGLIDWVWWKTILLWASMGLIGSVLGKLLWRLDDRVLINIERVLHLFIAGGAVGLWAAYFMRDHQVLP